uniref:CENPJ tubulin-binding region domain-containing protein n=1 Tax=Leptobrachium leishanense TaxID=445787 RepID=A0A8C5MA76_9ANUR
MTTSNSVRINSKSCNMKSNNSSVVQTSIQDPKDLSHLSSSIVLPQSPLSNTPAGTAFQYPMDVNENKYPLEFSRPNHQGSDFNMSVPQNTTQPDQFMMQQMEQLQRLVKEQQKIITLFNSGLSFPTGMTPPIIAMMPAIISSIPSENTQPQSINDGNAQTVSLGSSSQEEQISNVFSMQSTKVSSSPRDASKNANNVNQMDENLKSLTPVLEEKNQDCINVCPSPFGVRIRTKSSEERLIRPGIGERQKTFEEFVEEQLKVDTEIIQKEQLQSKQNTSRKSFLKRGEGITRFEKKSDNTLNEQTQLSISTLSRRVSFEGTPRNSVHVVSNTRQIPARSHVLQRQISSHSETCNTGNRSNMVTSNNSTANALTTEVHFCPQIHERKEGSSIDNLTKQTVDESCNLISQDLQEISIVNNRKTTGSSVQHSKDIVVETPQSMPGAASQLLNIKTTEQEGHLWPNSIRNIEKAESQTDIIDQSSDRVDSAGSKGFKKVNDRIIKVSQLSFSENGSLNKIRDGHREDIFHRKPDGQLSDSESTSSYSDDDSKSHCSKLPARDAPQRFGQVDEHLDLSDPDYASDESSGKENRRSKSSSNVLSVYYNHSFSTSDSEHSTEDFRRRGTKVSSFKMTSSARKAKEPDKEDCKDLEKVEFKNPHVNSSLLLNLFPTLKSKTDVTERTNLSNKSSEVCNDETNKSALGKEDIKEGIYDGMLLSKMKEEQAKAMIFLREQMDHLERLKTDELNRLEEFKKEEIKKIEREKETLAKELAVAKAIHESEKNEEIQMLKQQISDLQGKFRRNEIRWSSTHEQLRSQIEALTKENQELRSELHCMDISDNRSESLVSQAIMQGTYSTISDLNVEQSSHQSRSRTPMGRKNPVSTENGAKLTNLIQRAESVKPLTKNGERGLAGNVSISINTTGRKTPLQGRVTPFEPEKMVSVPVLTKHRKSPVTVSSFSLFKDPNISSPTRGKFNYSLVSCFNVLYSSGIGDSM